MRIPAQYPLVVGNCQEIDENGVPIRYYSDAPKEREQIIRCSVLIPQPSVFFSRHLLDKFGYLDETLDLSMDYDFFLRATAAYSFLHVPITLSRIRYHAQNKTAHFFLEMVEQILTVSRRYWGPSHRLNYWSRSLRARKVRSWAHLKIACGASRIHTLSPLPHLWSAFRAYPPSLLSRAALSLFARSLIGNRRVDRIAHRLRQLPQAWR
jgi:hypothetical protein